MPVNVNSTETITPFFPNGSFPTFQLPSNQLAEYRSRWFFSLDLEDNPPLTRYQRRCSPVRSLSRKLLASSTTSATPSRNTSPTMTRGRVLIRSSSTTLLRTAFPHTWRRSIVYSELPDRAFNALAAVVEALLGSFKLLGLHS